MKNDPFSFWNWYGKPLVAFAAAGVAVYFVASACLPFIVN